MHTGGRKALLASSKDADAEFSKSLFMKLLTLIIEDHLVRMEEVVIDPLNAKCKMQNANENSLPVLFDGNTSIDVAT